MEEEQNKCDSEDKRNAKAETGQQRKVGCKTKTQRELGVRQTERQTKGNDPLPMQTTAGKSICPLPKHRTLC